MCKSLPRRPRPKEEGIRTVRETIARRQRPERQRAAVTRRVMRLASDQLAKSSGRIHVLARERRICSVARPHTSRANPDPCRNVVKWVFGGQRDQSDVFVVRYFVQVRTTGRLHTCKAKPVCLSPFHLHAAYQNRILRCAQPQAVDASLQRDVWEQKLNNKQSFSSHGVPALPGCQWGPGC